MVQHSKPISDYALSEMATGGLGLEIAPYFDAFMSKAKFNVMYTDYLSNEEIRAKAVHNPDVKDADIPYIDFVWQPGVRFRNCAPPGVAFDYAVASHVMEHVPNPIGWLNEILEVMKIGGKIALFLPDRRYTFDYFRHETQFGELVQLWIEQPAVPTVAQVLDFMTKSFSHHAGVRWGADGAPVDTERAYKDQDAVNMGVHVHTHKSYTDIHCTVWNPNTVKDLFSRVVENGLMNVSTSDVIAENGEFLVLLTKLGEPARQPPVRTA